MKGIRRLFSFLLAVIFMLQISSANSLDGITGALKPVAGTFALTSETMNAVVVPLSLGYIREFYDSKRSDKPVVIYLQDAHCNYSCQKNIEALVTHFNEKYKVGLACVEGGAGTYNFSIFTSIPDMDVREKVADYFVREGRVTGTELFAIKNPGKITVKGLEEAGLYEKNLTVYRESLTYKEFVDKNMDTLRYFINNLKSPIFSNPLKEFDNEKVLYETSKRNLKEYVVFLEKLSKEYEVNLDKFPNFTRLMKVLQEEKTIDFQKADQERETVIDELSRKLSKREMAELIQRSMDFKRGDMTAADFYEYLFMMARSSGLDMKQYSNLSKYKAYLEKYDNVEKDVFFTELFSLESYIADNIAKKDNERKLFYLSNDLDIMNKLFSVSLTRQQYDYFLNKKDEISAKALFDFIGNNAQVYKMNGNVNPDVLKIDQYRDKITQFYGCSFERDQVFIKNMERYSAGVNSLFMVTGGFHTDNMKELLKKNGYSYILITPKLEKEQYNPYFKLLSGGISPIETVLSEYTSALALRSPLSEMANIGDIAKMQETISALCAFLYMGDNTVLVVPGEQSKTGLPIYLRLTTSPSTEQKADGTARSVGKVGDKELFIVKLSNNTAIDDAKIFDLTQSNISAFSKEWEAARVQQGGPSIGIGGIGRNGGMPVVVPEGKLDISPSVLEGAYDKDRNPIELVRGTISYARPSVFDMIVLPIDQKIRSQAQGIIKENERAYGGRERLDIAGYEDSASLEKIISEKIELLKSKTDKSPDITIYVQTKQALDIANAAKAKTLGADRDLLVSGRTLNDRVKIVRLEQTDAQAFLDIDHFVAYTILEHQKERYDKKEIEVTETTMKGLRELLVKVLKNIVANDADITEEGLDDYLKKIYSQLDPIRCRGVAVAIEKWLSQQRAVIISA